MHTHRKQGPNFVPSNFIPQAEPESRASTNETVTDPNDALKKECPRRNHNSYEAQISVKAGYINNIISLRPTSLASWPPAG